MARFSSSEATSLEKEVDKSVKPIHNESKNIRNLYEIDRCSKWIEINNFKKVCLQFPDYLLPDSTEVAMQLQEILGQTVYILGDTSYGSCCIDYVAASHINADAIIHFGPNCFSKTAANIPFMKVYEKWPLEIDCFTKQLYQQFPHDTQEIILLLLDTQYVHLQDKFQEIARQYSNALTESIDNSEKIDATDKIVVFIGENERKLLNIQFSLRPKKLFYFNRASLKNCESDQKILKRRYYLVEKIKDSKNVGIIIGTLGVKNYLKIINRIKELLQKSNKKYYLISVGKPTVAKLANFQEIDIYVIVTCALNEIYDNRDYYKPIVTPFDVELALNNNQKNINNFSYDFNTYLEKLDDKIEINEESDVSLLSGRVRISNNFVEEESGKELAKKMNGTLALNDDSNFGAGFLAGRGWKGLEQNLGENDVLLVEEGRSGLAQAYQHENT